MRWVSSRGGAPPITFVDALFAGTAPDGGLYMPERFDPLPPDAVEALRGGSVVDVPPGSARTCFGTRSPPPSSSPWCGMRSISPCRWCR